MMKKRVKSESQQLPTLPEHLIVDEILARLPVKSLVCFKSVSKYWHTTISSHEFQQHHLKLSSLCPQIIILDRQCWSCMSYLLSIDECNNNVKECDKLENKYPPVLNFIRFEDNDDPNSGFPGYYVVGSCNGLVCLYSRDSQLYVWNPATNQCQHVGFPDHGYGDIYDEDTPTMGFGYVSSIDDYRIGILLYEYGNDFTKVTNNWEGQVCVYSFRARKWILESIVENDDDRNLFINRIYQPVVVVDDFQYWSPIVKPNLTQLLGLNLINRKVENFELKNNLFNDYESVHISRIKGCLSLGCVKNLNVERGFYGRFVCDVWITKQPHLDPNSWEKVFSVNIRDPILHHLHFFEMGKGKGKRKCLVSQPDGVIKVMDLAERAQKKDNTFHHQRNINTKRLQLPTYTTQALDYVESLISPFLSYENEDESRERVEEEKEGVESSII